MNQLKTLYYNNHTDKLSQIYTQITVKYMNLKTIIYETRCNCILQNKYECVLYIDITSLRRGNLQSRENCVFYTMRIVCFVHTYLFITKLNSVGFLYECVDIQGLDFIFKIQTDLGLGLNFVLSNQPDSKPENKIKMNYNGI